jgi:hypothetical protein
MNLTNIWTIASKDLKSIRRKKSILYGILFFPLLLAFLFPAVVVFAARDSGVFQLMYSQDFEAFSFFFVIAAGVLPSAIAAYSIVGEKMKFFVANRFLFDLHLKRMSSGHS